jgi:hypothetical protein
LKLIRNEDRFPKEKIKENKMKKSLVFLVLGFFSFTFELTAQSQAKYQALYVYNFTRYIEWPSNGSQEFTIGVLGKSNVFNELIGVTNGKLVGSRNIVIKKYTSANEIGACQILFVSGEASSLLSSFASTLQNKNTLIITERAGLINKGSGINFISDDGKQKFELSKSNLNRSGLKVNNQLLDMAVYVN